MQRWQVDFSVETLHLMQSNFIQQGQFIGCLRQACLMARCNSTEFNANGQLFFQPLLQAMRIMANFGETLPDSSTESYQLPAKLLLLWAVTIFMLMLATFGIGAASGGPSQ